jgi:formate hydrogenlyase subunit 3/multisubunit Na+/H+ antiporter MnhD subunit
MPEMQSINGPRDSFPLFQVVPYPFDMQSWLLVAVLLVSAVAVGVLLRRYWWGMLWGLSPDIMDFAVLRPLTGEHPIHDLFKKVSTPWGFAVEMLLVVVVAALMLYLKGQKRAAAQDRVP